MSIRCLFSMAISGLTVCHLAGQPANQGGDKPALSVWRANKVTDGSGANVTTLECDKR